MKKKKKKKKGHHHIIIFYQRGVSPRQEETFVLYVQMSSSIVGSIVVQTVWLILFCIVVITNRGLSCTVYLLTGQSRGIVKKICSDGEYKNVFCGWGLLDHTAGALDWLWGKYFEGFLVLSKVHKWMM